jgi:hypothetical protein
VELLACYARDNADLMCGRGVTKVLSSLMFHQVPLEKKRAGLAAMHETLSPGGGLHIVDGFHGVEETHFSRPPADRSRSIELSADDPP